MDMQVQRESQEWDLLVQLERLDPQAHLVQHSEERTERPDHHSQVLRECRENQVHMVEPE